MADEISTDPNRGDVSDPAADMKADNPGEWMLYCHVSDHTRAGMLTSDQIRP